MIELGHILKINQWRVKRESGKEGNALGHILKINQWWVKRESGKEGNDRAWSHSKNKSVMSEKKEKHYNASIHIYVQLISVM